MWYELKRENLLRGVSRGIYIAVMEERRHLEEAGGWLSGEN